MTFKKNNDELVIWNIPSLLFFLIFFPLVDIVLYFTGLSWIFILCSNLIVFLPFIFFFFKVTTINSKGILVRRLFTKQTFTFNDVDIYFHKPVGIRNLGIELVLIKRNKKINKNIGIKSWMKDEDIDYLLRYLLRLEKYQIIFNRDFAQYLKDCGVDIPKNVKVLK